MLFKIFTAGLACAIPFASAYTQPKGDSPEGNPISQPGLNSIVPAGEAFSVTWEPTTKGTVTLVLLKGPSTNAVPQYAIAEKIPNNGVFSWTPKTDLAPTTDAEGYGIQLIDDATGAYQYTTQFGISNDDYVSSSSELVATSTPAATWSASPYGPHHGPPSGSWSDSWSSDSWTTSAAVSKPSKPVGTAPWVTGPIVTAPMPTGTGISTTRANVTMVAPTGGVTLSTKTSATLTSTPSSSKPAASSPVASNAAGSVGTSFAGFVFAGAVAVFAL